MNLWEKLLDVLTAGQKQIVITISLRSRWTGVANMKDWLSLLDAIHTAYSHPEYAPSEGVTHCNQFVNEVCTILGFREFDGKVANEIVDLLNQHPKWSVIEMERCQELANGGSLVIAGIKEEVHGHVNIISPGKVKSSGRWGDVPSCANIGKDNFIGKGINWAFSVKPTFWVWRQTL